MSVVQKAIDGVRAVLMLQTEVADLKSQVIEHNRLIMDIRERVIRIEALIEATKMRRLSDR